MSEGFTLTVPGEPRGQGRPRFARAGKGVRAYKATEDEGYEGLIRWAWVEAGRPTIPDGPYSMHIIAKLGRPKGHYKANGELSAAGERAPYPTRKPDLTNIAKAVEDALVGVNAIPDDSKIVSLLLVKRWGDELDGEEPGLRVDVWV